MVRKRPCKICRKWFRPNPRAGDRQHTCSDPSCQRERCRRAVERWRRRNPDYDRDDRLRKRLVNEGALGCGEADPMRALDWEEVRNAVGLEVGVVIEELGRQMGRWVRNAVSWQRFENKEETGRLPNMLARNGIEP
jgi:hypothetical protein